MFQVKKRDESIVLFNLSKIEIAIDKGLLEGFVKRIHTKDIIELLALKVCADFDSKIKDGAVSVEDIQDSVREVALIQASYVDVAKADIVVLQTALKGAQCKAHASGTTKKTVNKYLSINDREG